MIKIPNSLPLGATALLTITRTIWVDSSLGSCIASAMFSGLAIVYLFSAIAPCLSATHSRPYAFYSITVGYLLLELAAAQLDAMPLMIGIVFSLNGLAVCSGLLVELFYFAKQKKWI